MKQGDPLPLPALRTRADAADKILTEYEVVARNSEQ